MEGTEAAMEGEVCSWLEDNASGEEKSCWFLLPLCAECGLGAGKVPNSQGWGLATMLGWGLHRHLAVVGLPQGQMEDNGSFSW